MTSIEIEVCVKRRVLLLLPWGRVAGRSEMTLEAQSLACGTEMCVRRVVNKSSLTMHWKLCCILIDRVVFDYIPFPDNICVVFIQYQILYCLQL